MDPTARDSSEQTARAILHHYVESVTADLSGSIEAIVLCGSLATGSYVPGPSDIDQVTILRGSAPEEALPTALISIRSSRHSARAIEERLRRRATPVIARIEGNRVLLDLRTVLEEQDVILERALLDLEGED